MTDYRELIAEEQGTSHFDKELTKADVGIEEMATKMTEFCRNEGCQRSGGQICHSSVCGKCSSQLMYEDIAEYLYAAGYRKQSDTVRNILDAVTRHSMEVFENEPNGIGFISLSLFLNKLRKQYGLECGATDASFGG